MLETPPSLANEIGDLSLRRVQTNIIDDFHPSIENLNILF